MDVYVKVTSATVPILVPLVPAELTYYMITGVVDLLQPSQSIANYRL